MLPEWDPNQERIEGGSVTAERKEKLARAHIAQAAYTFWKPPTHPAGKGKDGGRQESWLTRCIGTMYF